MFQIWGTPGERAGSFLTPVHNEGFGCMYESGTRNGGVTDPFAYLVTQFVLPEILALMIQCLLKENQIVNLRIILYLTSVRQHNSNSYVHYKSQPATTTSEEPPPPKNIHTYAYIHQYPYIFTYIGEPAMMIWRMI